MEPRELFKKIKKEIDVGRMVENVKTLGQWQRYTGSEGGEKCVDYLISELKKVGIPVQIDTYDAFVSIPIKAKLLLDTGEEMKLIADVYSSEADGIFAELVYDFWSEKKVISENENRQRFSTFKNKLVLTNENGGEFAECLYRAGALGMLHISRSQGGYIHHSNIGAEWGTPCASRLLQIVSIPSAGISMEDGEKLILRLKNESVSGKLSICMDTGVRRSRMPYIDIPGKKDSFVMLNGHYDSWYEGITDNATSDAILLELAKAFWAHRMELERGIRIIWWSGHSDARYAGSTWFCDRHFRELKEKCIANINIDLAGCKNSEQVRARTTCMEGKTFTSEIIESYTKMKAKPYIPMIRGADQSFWGAEIPIHIMLKYEPTDKKRIAPCPSGGPWWHTDQDTIDKMDREILYRDALMNGEITCNIVNSRILPVNMSGYIDIMESYLKKIDAGLSEDFQLDGVFEIMEELRGWILRLEEKLFMSGAVSDDKIIKCTAGEMVRLVYTYGSPYGQDRATPYSPFGILENAVSTKRNNTSSMVYLFMMTEFTRACNRIIGQIERIISDIVVYIQNKDGR